MLPLVTIQEVCRLLEERKMSHRKIAYMLGVSRGTIGAISSGRRGMHGREPGAERPILCCLELPPERCQGCGGTVYKPCVLCCAREYKARQKYLQSLPMPRRVA